MAVTAQNRIEYTCYYRDLKKPGMHHLGDNLTGDGDGDDEVIVLNLRRIPPHVVTLYLTVHCFNAWNFSEVYDAYVRMFLDAGKRGGSGGKELIFHPLDGDIPSRGLVFCKLFRATRGWAVEALDWGCDGQTVMARETQEVILGLRKPYSFSGKARRTGKMRKPGAEPQTSGGCSIM